MSSVVRLLPAPPLAAAPDASAAFGAHDVPSTLREVTVLGYDHQLVEIEAVAALPEDRS